MKKTYIAPEILSIKLNPVQMLANSNLEKLDVTLTEESQVLSKGFGGGLWDDTIEDE